MPTPSEAPPSYDFATGSSAKPSQSNNNLQVPKERNGISALKRRSMEDELRKLPPGWVRQYDDKEHHQFFVDTNANPPRSMWHHPYDDDQYLSTLSSDERERIQAEEANLKKPLDHHMNTTDDEAESYPSELPPRPSKANSTAGMSHSSSSKDEKKGISGLGRKMKDKITGSTHEEREQERARREEQEREYYEMHMKFRGALQQAQMSGQPAFFAKDREGKDIYVEPPGMTASGQYLGNGSYGYNPYAQGVYGNPNARFIRPQVPYGRPYGGGYGGGMGMPLMGGMMGGMLLGGLLF